MHDNDTDPGTSFAEIAAKKIRVGIIIVHHIYPFMQILAVTFQQCR